MRVTLRRTKHFLQVRLLQRQEIVRARQTDDAGDGRGGQSRGREVAVIERQQRGNVSAGRVPHEVHARGIRPEFARMRGGPAGGPRRVGHEAGHVDLRMQPVIRHHGDVSELGHRGRDKPVIGLVAPAPAPSVPKNQQGARCGCGAAGYVQVQAVSRIGAILDVGPAPVVAECSRHIAGDDREPQSPLTYDPDEFPRHVARRHRALLPQRVGEHAAGIDETVPAQPAKRILRVLGEPTGRASEPETVAPVVHVAGTCAARRCSAARPPTGSAGSTPRSPPHRRRPRRYRDRRDVRGSCR